MKQKINRTANTVMAVVCLLIGLALLAGGIYLLAAADGDALTGGVLVGLGAFIVVLFACTMYLIFNFEKLQQKAEEKAAREAEARRAARRLEAERLRAERMSAAEAATRAGAACDVRDEDDEDDCPLSEDRALPPPKEDADGAENADNINENAG